MDAEVVDRILNRIVDGAPLRRCLRDEHVSARAWYAALDADETLAERYARSKEMQIDAMADDIMDIADAADDAQKARLQVDTRKWLLSKLVPKKYGDKVVQEQQGPDGGPVTHVYQIMTGVPRADRTD